MQQQHRITTPLLPLQHNHPRLCHADFLTLAYCPRSRRRTFARNDKLLRALVRLLVFCRTEPKTTTDLESFTEIVSSRSSDPTSFFAQDQSAAWSFPGPSGPAANGGRSFFI